MVVVEDEGPVSSSSMTELTSLFPDAEVEVGRDGRRMVRYRRVDVFVKHRRGGVDVGMPWLKECAKIGNDLASIGKFVPIILTHDGKELYGHLEKYETGRGSCMVGNELKHDWPVLYADLVVPEEIGEQITNGQWPRRSVYADLREKRIMHLALLGRDESWLGLKDLRRSPDERAYGRRATPRTRYVGCFVRSENVGSTYLHCYAKDDDDMPDIKDENEAAGTDAPPAPPDTGEGYEEETPPAPSPSDDGSGDMKSLLLRVITLLEKDMEQREKEKQPPPKPEGANPDEAAAAIEEELNAYSKAEYSVARKAMEEKVKAADGKIIDLARVRESHKKLYEKYGADAAEQYVDDLIETVPDSPGSAPDGDLEVDAKRDARAVAKYSKEQQGVITDAIGSGMPENKVHALAADYVAYAAEFEGPPELLPAMDDWIKYGGREELDPSSSASKKS